MAEKGTVPLSIVVPVLREDPARVARLAERVLAQEPDVELVVVDADPDGASLAALAPDPRLQALTLPEGTPPGRARQMNAGAAAAAGEVLLFLHADTRLPQGGVGAVRGVLALGLARAGAFDLAFDSPLPVLRLVAFGARLRSRIERLPYGDQCHFITRELFEELGGYPDTPIMEDVEFMRALRRRGEPIVILPERAVTSARRYEA